LARIFRIIPYFKRNRFYQDFSFKGKFNVYIKSIGKKFRINNWKSSLETTIFWTGLENGDWEPETVEVWVKLCKKANVIFDIGANTGVYTLIAKSTNPNCRVFAFEPSDLIIEKFKANMKLNNFQFDLIEKGVSNKTGSNVFYDVEDDHQTSASLSPEKLKNFANFVGEIREYQIETIRLDDFIKQNNILPDLIKIDVELHEPEVLEGMGEYLKNCQAVIILEVLTVEVAKKLNEILKEAKFQYFSLDKNMIMTVNELTPRNNIYNYLLIPEGKSINDII
jgi:FkbM family methyltransferase